MDVVVAVEGIHLDEDDVDMVVPKTSSNMAADDEVVVMDEVAGGEGFLEIWAVEQGGGGEDEKGAVKEDGVGVVGLVVETEVVLVL